MPGPRFKFERLLLAQGIRQIAGVDEAGRGPIAGPVVAAAAILPSEWMEAGLPAPFRGLNDSKQLPAKRRERFFELLTSEPGVRFAAIAVPADIIDRVNILRATHQAMNDALAMLDPVPDHALVDGLPVASLRFPQTALVDGDARSFSIAAASVIAKVTRDRLMIDFDRHYPLYGFAEHKGYGTPRHLVALAAHGPCPLHRRSFSPVAQPELPWSGL